MKLFIRLSVVILFLTGILFASSANPVRALSAGPDGFDYYYVDSVDPGSNPEEPVYNLEDISASGTLIPGLGDAGVSAPLNLGFSFRYYGVTYDQVYVCTNGMLTLVSPGVNCPYPEAQVLPNNIFPDPDPEPTGLVAGWWGDLDLTHSGAIYYTTLGIAPERYFVVEFLAVPHFDATWSLASLPLDPVTIEFKLFEGTNNIEVHYETAPASTLNRGGGPLNHSAGIENAAGTIGLQYYFDDESLTTPVAVRYYYNDAADPQINITAQPANPTSDPVGVFDFTVSDTGGSGLETVTCQLDSGGFNPCTTTFTTLSLGDGSHTFEINALDGAGNSASASYTWVVDTAAPDTTILTNPPDPSNSASATFTFSGSDPGGSGILRLECSLDGASLSTCTSPQNPTGLANGPHTFQVQAVDNAGNTDSTPASYAWVVDTVAPDTTILTNPPDPSTSSSATFTFSGSDTGTGLARLECRLDSGSFSTCTSPHNLSSLPDGSRTFQVRAVDNAGNPDPTPASYTWLVDTTPPDTNITANPPNPSASTAADFSFTGSDAGSGVDGFECRLDGAVFATCTSPQHLTGLSNATHNFQVRAIDNLGFTDPTPASYTWVVDTVAPDTTILTNPPDPSNSASPSFTFSGSDPGGSGVNGFECRLDGGGFAACTSPRNLTGLSNASHTFQVRAVDNAGNTDSTPASYTWVVDTAAPDTTILTNPPNPSGSTSASFTFSGSDTGTGLARLECQLDSAGFVACTSPRDLIGLSSASHTFQVRAVDNAGNPDPTPASYTWMVDTIPPDTNITANPPNPSSSATADFSFTGSDAGSGVLRLECRLDGAVFSTCTSPQHLTGLSDGPHTFQVQAVDNIGLTDPTPASYTWVVDTVPPDTTILTNPPNPSNSASPSFTFSGSDPGGSGVFRFECRLDGGSFSTCTSPHNLTSLSNASHTFQVRAVDTVGNTDSSAASYTWVVDTVAPDTTILINPPNPSGSVIADFTFVGSDTGGSGVTGFECRLDGASFSACTSPHNLTLLPDGSRTFQVRAVDAAGNSDSTPASYTWVVDTAAPTVTLLTQPANPTNITTGAFTFSGNGTGSALAAMSCKLDGGSYADCTGGSASYPGLSAGSHTFSVYAVDAAGNNSMASPTTYTWTVDTVAPAVPLLLTPVDDALTIQTSLTLTWQASPGAAGYLLILDGGALPPLGNVTSFVTPVLTTGEHTWSVAAYDAAGNTSVYATSFQFTVGFPMFLPVIQR